MPSGIVNGRTLPPEEWRLHRRREEAREADLLCPLPDRSIRVTIAPALIAPAVNMQSFVGKRLLGERHPDDGEASEEKFRRTSVILSCPRRRYHPRDWNPAGWRMPQGDASIWFMIAAAVFAALGLLSLVLIYGPQ